MKKVWIVVANSSECTIYRAENVNTLVKHETFIHEEGHLTDSDLIADRQGRQTHRIGFGTDTYQEQTPTQVKEASSFAQEIASFLEQGHNTKAFEHLYLISKPPFLGFLRSALNANVSKLIKSEIHKDLSQLEAKQIREYLPPVL
jgi:protein required for attachment to host cells